MKLLWALLKYSHVVFCFLVTLVFAPAAFAQHQDISFGFYRVATYGAGENVSDFIAKDHYVYLNHGGKLSVLDIADPAKAREIGSVKCVGTVVGIKGPALYFFDQKTFYIMDVSDPTHPRFHKSFDAKADDFHPALMGDYLMADEARKNGYSFYIFDVKNPLEPKLAMEGSHPDSSRPTPFCTDGKKLYAVGNMYGEDKYDIHHWALREITTSPTTIVALPYDSQCSFRFDARKVILDYSYYSQKQDSDISRSVPIPVSENSPTIWHLDPDWHSKTFENGWMLDECYGFDQYFHLARADKPEEVLLNMGHSDSDSMAMTKGAFYQLADGKGRIYDLSGDKPVDRGTFPNVKLPQSPRIGVLGSVAILNSTKSLLFFDISNPIAPVLRGEYAFGTHGGVSQVKISGKRAYLIDGDDGLVILDISNPKSPQLLARHQQPKDTGIRTLQGDHLFLSDGETGFRILDCANAKSPKELGKCKEGVGMMRISGPNLYVAEKELKILDISDLKNIHALGNYKSENPPIDMATSGTMVFLLTTETIHAVDASNPAKPVQVGMIRNRGNEDGSDNNQFLKRLHHALYLVNVGRQLGAPSTCDVIDISNPRDMKYSDHIGDDEAEAAARHPLQNPTVKYPGWYLCLPYYSHNTCDDNQGLEMYDCSDPLHPHVAGRYDGTNGFDVLLYKDTIYLADGAAGLVIIQH